MNKTSIEWTHRPETGGAAGGFTWNPIRARLNICPGIKRANGTDIPCGHRHDLAHRVCQHDGCLCDRKQTGTFCTRISPGCVHCYASTINIRFGNGLEFVVTNLSNIEFFIDEKILSEPLRRKKPATIFAGDMFDLFHEAIPDEMIAQVFNVMCCATVGCNKRHKHIAECWIGDGHTFQVLTKRADRMQRLISTWFADCIESWSGDSPLCLAQEAKVPPANIWLGVSVESQKYADERIPLLQQTPAAIRFLSVEPQLEDIWLEPHLMGQTSCGRPDWVICGGESGPGARPFNLAWAESLRDQCKAADVAFFMKQIGSRPVVTVRDETVTPRFWDSKGGDMSEWPESLRIREFPTEVKVAA
jgi:protein gp37